MIDLKFLSVSGPFLIGCVKSWFYCCDFLFRIWVNFIYPGEEYRGLPVIDFDVVAVVGGLLWLLVGLLWLLVGLIS